MNKKLYDVLRILQIVIPLLGTFYSAFAKAWGLGYAEPVLMTTAALTGLIGGLLKIDSIKFFKKNTIVNIEDEDGDE